MLTKRSAISNLLLYAIIIVAIYIVQRIIVFEPNSVGVNFAIYRELLFPEYLIAFSVLLFLSAWYIYAEYKRGQLKLHIPLIILLSCLFLISTIIILTFPSKLEILVPVYGPLSGDDAELLYYKNAVMNLNAEQRGLFILVSFAALYLAYLLIYVLPRKIRYTRQLEWLMYLILIFNVVLIAVSLSTEIDEYIKFFQVVPNKDFSLSVKIQGFLGNKNSFGAAMMFGVFASIYLHHLNGKWWFLPFPVIFTAFALVATSKTKTMICVIVVIVYFITCLCMRFKKHVLSSLIIIGVVLALIATAVSLYLVYYFNNDFMTLTFESVENIFDSFFIKAFGNVTHLSGRHRQYDKVIILLNNGYWAFGSGYGLFNYLFRGMENISINSGLIAWSATSITKLPIDSAHMTDSPHSFYYQIMGTGGIATLVIEAMLILYVIFAATRVFKRHKKTVIICLSFLLGAILEGLTEGTTLFFLGPVYIDSLLFTIFATTIILSLYHHEKHPSENRVFLANYGQNTTKFKDVNKSALIAKSLYFFLAPATVILCVITPLLYGEALKDNLPFVVAIIVVASLFVVAPIVAQLISDRKTKFTKFLLDVVAPYYGFVIVFGGFVYIYYLLVGGFGHGLAGILLIATCLAEFTIFSVFKYFRDKAGIISYLLDKFCDVVHKHQAKYIEVSNEKDSQTLQEKFFTLITPKRFKQNETTNN